MLDLLSAVIGMVQVQQELLSHMLLILEGIEARVLEAASAAV